MARKSTLVLGGIFALALVAMVALVAVVFARMDNNTYFPEPGNYDLPDPRSRVAPLDGSLNITLPGNRIEVFSITDVDLGEAGLTPVLLLTGDATSGSRLRVQAFTADGITCPRLIITDVTASLFIAKHNTADGMSTSFSGGAASGVTFGSTRGATNYTIANSTYDKISIASGSSSPIIKTLTITNVNAFGGECIFRAIDAGTFAIINSRIGTGDGVINEDFVIGPDVVAGTPDITNNTDDEPVDVR